MRTMISFVASLLMLSINKNVNFAPITLVVLFSIGLCSISFAFDVTRSKSIAMYEIPILVGYFIRICFMFLDVYGREIYVFPCSGGDTEGFFKASSMIANGKIATYGSEFTLLLGNIYRITGVSRLWGQYIIVMFQVFAIVLLAKALVELKIEYKKANRALYLANILPNFAILAAVYLRESLIVILCTLSLYYFVLWMNRKNNIYYVLAMVFPCLAAPLHSGVIGITVGIIIARVLYNNKIETMEVNAKAIVPCIVMLFAFAYIYLNYGEKILGKIYVTSAADISSGDSVGGSSYARYVGNSSSVFNLLIYTIPRYIYFLCSPFPWQWRTLSDIIAFVFSALFYLFTIINAIKYLRETENCPQKSKLMAILIVIISETFIYAWGVANTGTAIRHRDKVFLWFVIVYAMSYNNGGVHLYLGKNRFI